MSMIFFTYRSQTLARRGAERLKTAGIAVALVRTPAKISVEGCGYALRVGGGQAYAAALELRGRRITYQKSYLWDGRNYREVTL